MDDEMQDIHDVEPVLFQTISGIDLYTDFWVTRVLPMVSSANPLLYRKSTNELFIRTTSGERMHHLQRLSITTDGRLQGEYILDEVQYVYAFFSQQHHICCENNLRWYLNKDRPYYWFYAVFPERDSEYVLK